LSCHEGSLRSVLPSILLPDFSPNFCCIISGHEVLEDFKYFLINCCSSYNKAHNKPDQPDPYPKKNFFSGMSKRKGSRPALDLPSTEHVLKPASFYHEDGDLAEPHLEEVEREIEHEIEEAQKKGKSRHTELTLVRKLHTLAVKFQLTTLVQLLHCCCLLVQTGPRIAASCFRRAARGDLQP